MRRHDRGGRGWRALLLATACTAVLPLDARAGTLAVVVSQDSRVEALDRERLAQIYRRKRLFWEGGKRVIPVNLPADDALRLAFSIAVLGASPEALQDYWNQQYFQGVAPPHVLQSLTAVTRFVRETDGALGYVPDCALGAGLRVVLRIETADVPDTCSADE